MSQQTDALREVLERAQFYPPSDTQMLRILIGLSVRLDALEEAQSDEHA